MYASEKVNRAINDCSKRQRQLVAADGDGDND